VRSPPSRSPQSYQSRGFQGLADEFAPAGSHWISAHRGFSRRVHEPLVGGYRRSCERRRGSILTRVPAPSIDSNAPSSISAPNASNRCRHDTHRCFRQEVLSSDLHDARRLAGCSRRNRREVEVVRDHHGPMFRCPRQDLVVCRGRCADGRPVDLCRASRSTQLGDRFCPRTVSLLQAADAQLRTDE
jgi:hypothetical protein